MQCLVEAFGFGFKGKAFKLGLRAQGLGYLLLAWKPALGKLWNALRGSPKALERALEF